MAGRGDIIKTLVDRIRAYHGSPHEFEKFDISKLGTGEGAQMMGRGHYLADVEATAKHYRDMLSDPFMKYQGQVEATVNKLKALGVHPMDADQMAYLAYEGGYKPGQSIKEFFKDEPHLQRYLDNSSVRKLIDEYTKPSSGHMYEVDIKARPEQLITLDSPMSQQSDIVREAVGRGGKNRGKWTPHGTDLMEYSDRGDVLGQISREYDTSAWSAATGYGGGHWKTYPSKDAAIDAMNKHFASGQLSGEQAYGNVVKRFRGDEEEAAKYLADRNVMGLRYLDELSRDVGTWQLYPEKGGGNWWAKSTKTGNKLESPISGGRAEAEQWLTAQNAAQPTYNYVIPHDDSLEVLRKYGIAGASALPPVMGALAAQDQYGAQQ